MLFGDAGQIELGDLPKATSFGVGVYYQIQDVFDLGDSSIKASYHKSKLDSINRNTGLPGRTVEFTFINIELLVSASEPINPNGLRWFATVGAHRFDAGNFLTERVTKVGFGIGVFLPVSSGELYAGANSIASETTFGVGFRYKVR